MRILKLIESTASWKCNAKPGLLKYPNCTPQDNKFSVRIGVNECLAFAKNWSRFIKALSFDFSLNQTIIHAVVNSGFFGRGGPANVWGSDFRESERNFTIAGMP